MLIKWNERSLKWFINASEYTGFHLKLSQLLLPHIEPGSTICDLGCGMGLIDLQLAKSAGRITCVDINEIPLRWLEEEAAKRGITNIETIQADSRSLTGPWDTVITLFYDTVGEQMADHLRMCRKNVISVVHGSQKGNIGLEAYKPQKCGTVANAIRNLEKLNAKWSLSEHHLEYGQPFENMEEAVDFVKAYSINPPETAVDEYLRNRLERTGDPRWPLYLPSKKHIGIFVVEKL